MSDCFIEVRKGSFRGVEFHYDSGSVSGGRRGATHEYPFREDHYDQDLGKVAPRFSASGYVSGDNIRDKIRQLENAFNTQGHGVYYDAWRNREVLVRCESWSIDTSRIDLGRASFQASFVERGAEPAPSAIRSAIAGLNTLLSNFNEALATGYNLINGTIDDVQSLADGFVGATSYFSFAHRRNFATSDAVKSASASLSSANPLDGAQAAVSAAVGAVLDAQTGAQQLAFLDYIANIQATGDIAADNQALIFGGTALASYAEVIIGADYEDRTTANVEITAFIAAVNSFKVLADSLGLYDVSQTALCLAASAGDRVSTELGDTPFVSTTQGGSLPALVLSYRLFGNIDHADELIARNCSVNGSAMKGDVVYIEGR